MNFEKTMEYLFKDKVVHRLDLMKVLYDHMYEQIVKHRKRDADLRKVRDRLRRSEFFLKAENKRLDNLIEAIYNIDTKYIDEPTITCRDFYNDIMDLIEKHKGDK